MQYKYFNVDEFKCNCCGKNEISKELISKLDVARATAGIPFRINSGYRCINRNADVGGSRNSSHLKGLAVDISCRDDLSRFKIVDALLLAGFTRIGISSTFIHVDIDDKKSDAIWFY